MKLSVVIVGYNVRYYLEQCLASVMKATEGMDCEVIVVDNDSTDGTLDYLKQRIPEDVIFIESNHNLGFARANNIAIRQSQGEYVLLFEPRYVCWRAKHSTGCRLYGCSSEGRWSRSHDA